MNNADFDKVLQHKIDGLDRQSPPERDLWPGIERNLHRRPSQTGKRLGIAASVALVACAGWWGLQQQRTDAQWQILTQLSSQHQQQLDSLLVKYADQPAVTDNWQAQIQELDAAAAAVKAALENDPDNLALLKMLKQIYQQQIELVEKVHAPAWQRI